VYYKILSEDMLAFGFHYHVGVNRMENPDDLGETLVAENGESYEAGLYFADADNILAYCHFGEYIATVEIADNATLECWGNGEYSTDALEILNIRPLWDVQTIKELEREGVDFTVDNNSFLSWAREFEKRDVVTYLEKNIYGPSLDEQIQSDGPVDYPLNQNYYSKFSTEELVKMEKSAYADYYKLATTPRTNPSKKDLEPLEKATAIWEAICEELSTRKQPLNAQIQSASSRAAESHSPDKSLAKESTPER